MRFIHSYLFFCFIFAAAFAVIRQTSVSNHAARCVQPTHPFALTVAGAVINFAVKHSIKSLKVIMLFRYFLLLEETFF